MLNASRCTNQSTLNNLTSNGGFDGESFQKQQTMSNCFLKYCCFHCFWCCCSNLHLKVPNRVLPQGCPSQSYWFAGRFCPQPYSLGPISVSALYVGQKTSQSFQTNFADKLWTEVARRTWLHRGLPLLQPWCLDFLWTCFNWLLTKVKNRGRCYFWRLEDRSSATNAW